MTRDPASSIELRSVREEDAGPISALLEQLGHPVPPGPLAANLEVLRSTPRCGTFVALLEGRVVGAVSAFVTPVLHRPAPVGRVSVLVVDESLTGRGIGAALLRHAESFLASHGCARVEVTSAAHREAAHRFYERQGYARQGVRFSRDLAADPDAAAGQKR